MQLDDIWRPANLLVLTVLGIQQRTHMTAFFPHTHRANVANISKLAAFLGTNYSLALLHVLRDSFGIKHENFAEKAFSFRVQLLQVIFVA